MNGIIELKAGKKTYKLRFNYNACMEFEQKLFNNPSASQAKTLTDLIYSGLFGEALRSETAVMPYGDVCDLLDELSLEKNYSEQIKKVWNIYNESKWGADFQERLKEFNSTNKKKEEL